MKLIIPCKRKNDTSSQPTTNKENISFITTTAHKATQVNRDPTTTRKEKWTYQSLEEAMEFLKSEITTMKATSRLWIILLSSLANHLNGQTKNNKGGVGHGN